jgi:hypothetical protein
MPIKSRNLSTAAEFAKQLFVTNLYFPSTGSTITTAALGAIILPFRAKILSVVARTLIAGSASVVDVREAGTSILSAAVTLATTVSTNATGTVSDDDVASGAVLDVVLTKGTDETIAASVIVTYRPFLSVPERVAKSMADES